jgi:hypothetical protein
MGVPKYGLQSLDELSRMYGTKSAFQIAQSVVYGVKPKVL